MEKLLIVESPGKIEKIKKILGASWEVLASYGHIADLPQKELGIDPDNRFKMNYVLNENSRGNIKKMKAVVSQVSPENVYLGTDLDREGEAIAFHVARELKLNLKTAKRVTFNAINDKQIKAAVTTPRTIDLSLVYAQETRRAIDRLVGYIVSPILWKKIESDGQALSAGRVQSVAMKLAVDKERQIKAHQYSTFFSLSGDFSTAAGNRLKGSSELKPKDKKETLHFLNTFGSTQFAITDITKQDIEKKPSPPFTTSSLQMDANKKLKFSPDKTMQVAQKLYEGGFITYMRTDCVNLSEEALKLIEGAITKAYGKEYFQTRTYKSKGDAQEAHEAIRATDFEKLADTISDKDQSALYDLIWKRTMACQMISKVVAETVIELKNKEGTKFLSKANVVRELGFERAYKTIDHESDGEEKEDDNQEITEPLTVGQEVKLTGIAAKENFKAPPKRYNTATLVKALENKGIGRPSTYASIMNTIIQKRSYVAEGNIKGEGKELLRLDWSTLGVKESKLKKTFGQQKNVLYPNEIAYKLCDFLVENTPDFMDYSFTKDCESIMDKIAQGKGSFLDTVSDLYSRLSSYTKKIDAQYSDVERERKSTLIGKHKGKAVYHGKSEHGYYLKWDKFYPATEAVPALEEAIAQIEQNAANTKKPIYEFGELKVFEGKFGMYFQKGKDVASVPKWDVDKLESWDKKQALAAFRKQLKYKKTKGKKK